MFRNPGKHLSIHLMNFYNSQLSECKHCELLSVKGREKAPFYFELVTSPIILSFTTFSVIGTLRGFVYFGGCGNLEELLPEAAAWRLHEAAMRAQPGPAQALPLAAATSALLYPVTLSLSLCSSLFMMDTFPSQSHMPGARRSEQINYFQLQAWQAWAGGGGWRSRERGLLERGPSAPQPAGRGAASRSPGIWKGMTLGLSDPF